MKKINFLIVFVLFVLFPFSVNAEEFKNNEAKYFIEKANLICEINGEKVNLDDTSKYDYVGMDENANFIYLTLIKDSTNLSNEVVYVLNVDGCKKYNLVDEIGVNYVLSALDDSLRSQYIGIEDNKVFIETIYGSIKDIYKEGNPDEIDLNKNNYCQYNEILGTTTCGIIGSNVDLTKEFTEILHLKLLPSTNIDTSNTSLKYYKLNDKTSMYEEVSVDSVKKAIKEAPINAIQYYIESNDTKEYVMTIVNETVLELLNKKYATIYDYDSINKIAYFYYGISETNYGVIDSNGKDYGKYLEPYHYSNNLVWSLLFNDDKTEYVIADLKGNILHTFKDFYFEVDDDSSDLIYELNSIYKPFHEIKYENYTYDLFVNGISKNNIYRVYEYKLLSEDNRTINVSSSYVAKFSGLTERVKKVMVDTYELDVDTYVTGKNTIVTLDNTYLKSLNNGEHILTVEYEDGIVLNTKFTLSSENEYKLTFDANGGVYKDGKSSVYFDNWNFGKLSTQEQPTRDGYKFIGWYTEKKDGIPLAAEPSMVNVTTVYAQWEKIEEIPNTYDSIGDSILMGTISFIVLVGTTIYLKKRYRRA